MHALLAIKPEFADKILEGEKKYEFRRTSFKDHKEVGIVFLYSTSPVKRIVGFFTTDRVVEASPDELWDLYGDKSGINNRERFMNYFEEQNTGYAIHVENVHQFHEPINPADLFEDFSPPMSFNYVNRKQENALMEYVPQRFRDTTEYTDLTEYTSNKNN